MKLYAQQGYGEGDKIINGLHEKNIDGVILSSRHTSPDKINEKSENYKKENPDADILLDPEFFVSLTANEPNAQLRNLEDWKNFIPFRRSELEAESKVSDVLKNTFDNIIGLPLSAIIAPNIYIKRSFESIEALISKNFIRKTKNIFTKTGDKRPVYATLAINSEALLKTSEFKEFLNDITVLENPPDGFYILVGASSSDARSDIFHADVIAGWMLLNYTLSLNGFDVINGYSDIVTPFLSAAGAKAGATGWWSKEKIFSIEKYIQSNGGGRLPIVRYLSKLLLNRITFSERDAFSRFNKKINNGLPHDQDYASEEPSRNIEILQCWEAIKDLNRTLISSNDANKNLKNLFLALDQAQEAYEELFGHGLQFDPKSNSDHIEAFREGLKIFKKNAEIG